jgi:hypothetical protein
LNETALRCAAVRHLQALAGREALRAHANGVALYIKRDDKEELVPVILFAETDDD